MVHMWVDKKGQMEVKICPNCSGEEFDIVNMTVVCRGCRRKEPYNPKNSAWAKDGSNIKFQKGEKLCLCGDYTMNKDGICETCRMVDGGN